MAMTPIDEQDRIPLCCNCKHFRQRDVFNQLPKTSTYACDAPQRRTWNPVFGAKRASADPFNARKATDDCGPAGKWFEPSEKLEPATLGSRGEGWV